MTDGEERALFEAIERDDLNTFAGCMEKENCGRFRFGRFPVLSVMYLFNAKKLVKAYEGGFIKINNWAELKEPAILSAKLRKRTGKSLRFYLDEIITPLEMLLICGKVEKFKKLVRTTPTSAAVKERLVGVYNLKYDAKMSFEGGACVMARRPLSVGQKKIICVACICGALFIGGATCGAYFLARGDVNAPFLGEDGIWHVKRAADIDFSSDTKYVLEKNITLYSGAETALCEIDGNGKTIEVKGGDTLFENFAGTIKNCTFKTDGSCAVIDKLYGTVENVRIVSNTSYTTDSNFAFFVNVNCGGILDGVSLEASGTLGVAENADGGTVTMGGIVYNNVNTYDAFGRVTSYGVIKNCGADYSDFKIVNSSTSTNASFGGIVGVNKATVQYCKTTGKIEAETVDTAGICSQNTDSVTYCKNGADIEQSSSEDTWNPVVAGITLENYSEITGCVNTGNLYATSTAAIKDGDSLSVSVGGIIAKNGFIANTLRTNISAFSCLKSCINEGNISASGASGAHIYAGGIACELLESVFYPNTEYQGTYGGTIMNCYFTGKILSAEGYKGGIAACVGKTIFEINLYYLSNKRMLNLEGNYYAEDCGAAAGVGSVVEYGEPPLPNTYFSSYLFSYFPVTDYGEGADKETTRAGADEIKALTGYIGVLNTVK